MIDSLSDMLTRIRNSLLAKRPQVEISHSGVKFEIAKILEQEGYLAGFTKEHQNGKEVLVLNLKYVGKEPVIREIKMVSKPGQRIYLGAKEIPSVLGGLGIVIVSTSRGIMTGRMAKKQNLGGEVLIKIW
jgi:small subunit ribosomal protein S8